MPMTVQLSQAERELLLDILTNRIGDLRQEIHHSTVSTFTDQLKQTEVLMKELLAKIESAGREAESGS